MRPAESALERVIVEFADGTSYTYTTKSEIHAGDVAVISLNGKTSGEIGRVVSATKTDTAVDTIVSTAVSLFYREKHRQNKHSEKQALHFGSISPILQRFFHCFCCPTLRLNPLFLLTYR